ncbi:uncharacterized protein LOC123553252 [Mercenaria mercenaria]|uniref:uncharacterized protein LOC123553252 n=1 Tax=Mercenaria mercenaria TaxID=6596 RepID=UPI00234F62E1|nr:uncharacterized protein LOC123553252 [Mercenaria mercenaria]
MRLSFVLAFCSFAGISGFVYDADVQGLEYESLRQCMNNFTTSNNQEFTNCMAKTNMPEPNLCSVTLNGFQCNLDFIMKTCPSSADFYKKYNYYTVRACNSTFQIPGHSLPIVASSGNNTEMSSFAFGFVAVASLVEIF